MAVVSELIRKESDGTISFGNFLLEEKTKLADFEHEGDLYKVKSFYEITKLERNGMFVYESVPGTAVFNMLMTEDEVTFDVSTKDTAQIALALEPEKEYEIRKDGVILGRMKTNLGGKLVFSIEQGCNGQVGIKVVKL